MGPAQTECYMGTSISDLTGSPNSYWIVQENGEEQPRVYRRFRHMLKIRSSTHGSDQNTHEAECAVENSNVKFHHQSTFDDNRNQPAMNSIKNYTPGEMQSALQTPDLPISTENREESQPVDF